MANREAQRSPRPGRGNGVANAAELRAEIDSGGTGDKVDALDPAAAPLGTDDEAGGDAITPQEASLDARTEAGETARGDEQLASDQSRDAVAGRRASPVLILGMLLAVLALGLVLFFLGARG